MSDSAATKRRSSSFIDSLKRGSSKERSESKERRSSHSQSEVELSPLCQTTTASDSSESEPTKKKDKKKDKKSHGHEQSRLVTELSDMLRSRSRETQQAVHNNNNNAVTLDDTARMLGVEKQLRELVIKVDGIANYVIIDHNALERIEEKVDDLGGDDMECCFCLPWCQPK